MFGIVDLRTWTFGLADWNLTWQSTSSSSYGHRHGSRSATLALAKCPHRSRRSTELATDQFFVWNSANILNTISFQF